MCERFEKKVVVASHAYSKVHSCIINLKISMFCIYFIAVQRWILKAHDRAKILQTCRETAGMYDAAIKHHKVTSAPRM